MSPSSSEVPYGTLDLMVLKTVAALGPLHGYGIARRIEQISGDLLAVNYGTLYPALLKLEQEDYITSEWGVSDNNRRAKYYRLTRAGQKPAITSREQLPAALASAGSGPAGPAPASPWAPSPPSTTTHPNPHPSGRTTAGTLGT